MTSPHDQWLRDGYPDEEGEEQDDDLGEVDLAGVPGCVHRSGAAGDLCGLCLGEYAVDPSAWLEYGEHPAGIVNWKRLQAEMDQYAAECAAIPRLPACEDDIPF